MHTANNLTVVHLAEQYYSSTPKSVKEKIRDLPDIAKSFQKIVLAEKLGGIEQKSLISIAIHYGLENSSIDEVLAMVKTQIADNAGVVEGILGKELLLEIKNF